MNTRKQVMFWRIIFVTILPEYFLLWDLFFWIEVLGACSCLRERGLSVRPSQAEHEYACVLPPSLLPSSLTCRASSVYLWQDGVREGHQVWQVYGCRANESSAHPTRCAAPPPPKLVQFPPFLHQNLDREHHRGDPDSLKCFLVMISR